MLIDPSPSPILSYIDLHNLQYLDFTLPIKYSYQLSSFSIEELETEKTKLRLILSLPSPSLSLRSPSDHGSFV